MIRKIQKWGNSLGLRIPRALAEDARLEEGTTVELTLEKRRLILKPRPRSRYKLSQLLARITPRNLHEEIRVSGRLGREAW